MKRIFWLLAIAAITSLASSQTHLAITQRDHPVGFATLNQRVQQDGMKIVELRMEFTAGTKKINITTEARYDAKGMPVRKYQQTLVPGGSDRQVIATFGKEAASVVLLEGDKRTTKSVTLPTTAPRGSMSEFWFIRDKPKVGQVEESYDFNSDTLEWELVRSEYRGPRTLQIEGRNVHVHEVVTKRGEKRTTSYLDDQGLPVLVDQGDVKMVKIWAK